MSKTDLTLAQLRVLAAVVDVGSFTEAAEVLGISQSGVSQAIASLEGVLGLPVLHRDRNGVGLTEAGERILVHARAILSRADVIRQEAAAVMGVQTGKIRIGSVASFAARLLPGMMRTFQSRHPGVELVLLEGSDGEVLDWLQSGAIDVAAVVLPVKGVDSLPVARDQLLVVLPDGHPLANESAIAVADLEDDPFIMPSDSCERMARRVFAEARAKPDVRFDVRDQATLLMMVREGLGVSLLPALAIPSSVEGVRTVPLAVPVWRELALGVRSGDAPPPALAAFLREAERWAVDNGFR
jgi:DNA-binding transcriptional LysR family regulator